MDSFSSSTRGFPGRRPEKESARRHFTENDLLKYASKDEIKISQKASSGAVARPAEKGSNNILCCSHNGRRKKKRKGSKGLIILPRPVSFERDKKRFSRRLQPSLRLWPCSGRVWTAHVELFALILIKKLFVSLSTSDHGFIPHHFASSRPLINYEIPLRKFFHFIHFSRARPLFPHLAAMTRHIFHSVSRRWV